MTALPGLPTEGLVRDALERLSGVVPGPSQVVSCYLKLEPRDKTRGKYLVKMKNRVREVQAGLEGQDMTHAARETVAADLGRVQRFFEEPARLPPARGIAIFACTPLGLFEAIPLPHVHRSRLAVRPVPLIRELVALEEEFGAVVAVACDRTGARFFEVTAYDVAELTGLVLPGSRTTKFHGSKQVTRRAGSHGGSAGEHHFHQRIREEKHRLYAAVADRLFQLHTAVSYTHLTLPTICSV